MSEWNRQDGVRSRTGSVRTEDRKVPAIGSVTSFRYAAVTWLISSRQQDMKRLRRSADGIEPGFRK